jgi:hypothetical protein
MRWWVTGRAECGIVAHTRQVQSDGGVQGGEVIGARRDVRVEDFDRDGQAGLGEQLSDLVGQHVGPGGAGGLDE